MKDKCWSFSIFDKEKNQSIPVKAMAHPVKAKDEDPKKPELDLSEKDLAKLSAILGAISDKNLDAVVEAIKAIKPAKKEDGDNAEESEADKKVAKDEKFDVSEFSVGSDEGEEESSEEESGEEVINTENQDSVMHDSKRSVGSLLKRTNDSKPEGKSLDDKWQAYYDKRNKEE